MAKNLLKASKSKRFKTHGQSLNVIKQETFPHKIAVLELSSRAVKAVVGNLYYLLDGFKWGKPAFINQSKLTYTEQLLNSDTGDIDIVQYRQKVLTEIKKLRLFCEDQNAKQIICIATAVYRNANNYMDILALIKSELGLNVQIIDKDLEAISTFQAYLWAQGNQMEENILLIDQGGGSTEISLFDLSRRKQGNANINIGTESILNQFYKHYEEIKAKNDKKVEKLFADSVLSLQELVLKNLDQLLSHIDTEKISFELVGVGTSITNATQLSSNEQQHNTLLNRDYLEKQLQKLELIFAQDYLKITQYHEQLIEYFGLKMFVQLMDAFHKTNIKVNGASLRYGIFKTALDQIYSPIKLLNDEYLGTVKKALEAQLDEFDGFKESFTYDGYVIAYLDYALSIALSKSAIGIAPLPKGKQLTQYQLGSKYKVKLSHLYFDHRKNKYLLDLELI